MQTRFVVVPAVPLIREIHPRRIGFPSALGEGYDLYDTQDKIRLSLNLPTRAQAEYECTCRNGCVETEGRTGSD
ncbi:MULTISPECIES: hypothetical protein [unclassified Pseudomonas]|uniref:hypothetical protein n=1 Tax=unclassified Pseudomonas TaxID=196821 RepID=UPI000760DBDC|nr:MULTISPECIES: hypothetical protein [unclassified Pseudomonas]MBK5007161.1 hypothetical protein [Pseudomonas sp. S32]